MDRLKDKDSGSKQALTQKDYTQLSFQINQMKPQVMKLQRLVHQVIALVGATGSGKSSLASYLRKAPLTFQKGKAGKYLIDHHDKTGRYPQIGHQKQSCTTLPGVYDQNGEAFVDLAGWFDTRSAKQQIVNGISNSLIFSPGKKVKVIIVVEEAELKTQRGGILIQIANRLIEFFQLDFAKIINSVLLVISKCKTEDWDIETVQDEIRQTCEKNENLKQNTRFLLKTLIQKKRIALFPIPTEIKDHIDIISQQLSGMRPTILSHNGCVTLSPKAVNMICSCLGFLNHQLNVMAKDFSKDIQNQVQKKPIKDGKKADKILRQLNVAYRILQSEMKQCATMQQYESLLDQLTSKLNVSTKITAQIKINFNMIEFYTKLNKNAKIDNGFLQTIRGKLKEVISKVSLTRDKLVSNQEKKKLEQEYKKEMKQREKRNKQQLLSIKKEMQERQRQIQQNLRAQQKRYDQQMENHRESQRQIQKQLQKVQAQNNQKKKAQQKAYGIGQFLLDVGTLGIWRLFK